MRNVTDEFNRLFDADSSCEIRCFIAGQEYTAADIISARLASSAIPGETPTIGNAIAAQLQFAVEPKSNIRRMAKIELELRLTDGATSSEWLPYGTYFIDTRETSADGEYMEITAYDAMLKAEQTYKDLTAFTTWPQTDTAIVNEICTLMGVTLDSRTSLAGYGIGYPNDYTMREMLGYIGAGNGGNWIITPENKLRLVPLVNSATAINVGRDMTAFTDLGAVQAFTGVTFYYADESAHTAGNDTGRVLEADMPWATQAMADALLASIQGYVYHGFTAENVNITPAFELGDIVTANGVTAPIMSYNVTFDGSFYPNISAPSDLEVDNEYKYESKTARQLKRTVKLGESYYGTKITREDGLVIEKTDGTDIEASVTLNADELAFKDGNGNDVLYYDREKGTFVFDGSLGADAVFTDSLYAEQGNVADLTVNRLDTGDYIKRYFTRDVSDLNHIQILSDSSNLPHIYLVASSVKKSYEAGDGWERLTNTSGEVLYWTDELMTTATLESTEYPAYIAVTTLINPYGESVYWSQDISEATITDGYPYIDGVRVYTTATITGYPVTIWDYASQNKADLTFVLNPDSGYYEPRFVLGAGDQLGTSKGYIYKGANGLDIRYDRSNQRGELSIHLNDSGEITKSLTDSGDTIQGAVQGTLVFENVSVTASSWTLEATPTFTSYPYAAVLTCTGATSAMGGEVIFSPDDVESGKLASAAKSDTDTVTIYATEPMTITVLRIELRF